jgi:hypothetical protein
VEVNGANFYRNVIYPVTISDTPVALTIEREKVGVFAGFLQKFIKPATREGRQQ